MFKVTSLAHHSSVITHYFNNPPPCRDWGKPTHTFLGGKGLGIQQGTSVWVGSPKSPSRLGDFQKTYMWHMT